MWINDIFILILLTKQIKIMGNNTHGSTPKTSQGKKRKSVVKSLKRIEATNLILSKYK